MRTRVNGELLQQGTTANLIFGPAEVVAWLSRTMTLLPGDIIATGTPAGVGVAQGRFLKDGDTVEVEIDGLGALVNPVRSEHQLKDNPIASRATRTHGSTGFWDASPHE